MLCFAHTTLLHISCQYEVKLKEAGVDAVVIYCVNDPAVMMAWGKCIVVVWTYGRKSTPFI